MSLDYITESILWSIHNKKTNLIFFIILDFYVKQNPFLYYFIYWNYFYHTLLHKEFEMAQKIIYRKQVGTENQNQTQKGQKPEMKVGWRFRKGSCTILTVLDIYPVNKRGGWGRGHQMFCVDSCNSLLVKPKDRS